MKPVGMSAATACTARTRGRWNDSTTAPVAQAGCFQLGGQPPADVRLQEAVGLQLQRQRHARRLVSQQVAQLGQGRHAFRGELGPAVRCAERLDLRQRHPGHRPVPVGGAVHRAVVDADENAIGGQVQVGLDDVRAVRQRAAERGQRVLRAGDRVAAVGHDVRFGSSGESQLSGGHRVILVRHVRGAEADRA